MRVALYARYSSDLQSDRSIGDQLALCREHAAGLGAEVVEAFSDAAISGSHAGGRPALQRMLAAAREGAFEAVLAEALDRISRDQEDSAGIFKRLRHAGCRLITVAEGEIGALHIGLKGTMNALFLEDLAKKVRRGLRGRVADGRSAGGLAYGYRVVKTLDARGEPVRGLREPHPDQAPVVRRIFDEYAAGRSTRAIAHRLNRDGIPGPSGGEWSQATIAGSRARRSGILWNEAYVGFLVWNRVRMVKDPETGRRLSRPNPPEEWVVVDAPALRLVEPAVWDAVQARRDSLAAQPLRARRRPKRLLSGLVFCAVCGGAYTVTGPERWGCATHRNRGTCANGRVVSTAALEGRVFEGLKTRLLAPELVAEYVRAYRDGAKARRRARSGEAAAARKALKDVEGRIARIVAAIEEGAAGRGMAGRLAELERRRETLEATIAAAAAGEPDVVDLHPGLADRYRRQIEALEKSLAHDVARDEAREILADMVRIEIAPGAKRGQVGIELVAQLAAVLQLAAGAPRRGAAAPGIRPTPRKVSQLVAGERYRLEHPTVRIAV